jgi:hypothetical protein
LIQENGFYHKTAPNTNSPPSYKIVLISLFAFGSFKNKS